MKQNLIWRLAIVLVTTMTFTTLTESAAQAQISSSLGRAVLRFFGKEGAEEAAEYLAKQAGKELVERVTKAAVAQGGEEAVEQVAKLVGKHGPEALDALGKSPAIMPVLKALDDIPEAQVKTAIRAIASAGGRELAETTSKFGSAALRSELKHPGIGAALVRELGEEGAELAGRLSGDQAITVGRYAKEIGKLPAQQRKGVVGLLGKEMNRTVSFMGRFAERNPGKVLFSVAATTVILAQSERILGGDELVFDAQGNPVLVSKPGLAGRTLEAGGKAAGHVSNQYLQPLFYAALAFGIAFAVIWGGLKLYHTHQREKLLTNQMVADEKSSSKQIESSEPDSKD